MVSSPKSADSGAFLFLNEGSHSDDFSRKGSESDIT